MPELPKIDIIKELAVIKKKGFIKSLRMGDTGIGHTLEHCLGIKENNENSPDFIFKGDPVELKTQREYTGSNITLFTLEPPRGTKGQFKDINLLKKYGYTANGRKDLYITMNINSFNAQGFKLHLNEDSLKIIHKTDGVIWVYPLTYLIDKIKKKLSHKVLLVTAECEKGTDGEYFHYNSAYLFSGISDKGFVKLIKEGALVVEFRMHINSKGGARNHGTPFRLNSRHLDKLFSQKRKIL